MPGGEEHSARWVRTGSCGLGPCLLEAWCAIAPSWRCGGCGLVLWVTSWGCPSWAVRRRFGFPSGSTATSRRSVRVASVVGAAAPSPARWTTTAPSCLATTAGRDSATRRARWSVDAASMTFRASVSRGGRSPAQRSTTATATCAKTSAPASDASSAWAVRPSLRWMNRVRRTTTATPETAAPGPESAVCRWAPSATKPTATCAWVPRRVGVTAAVSARRPMAAPAAPTAALGLETAISTTAVRIAGATVPGVASTRPMGRFGTARGVPSGSSWPLRAHCWHPADSARSATAPSA